MAGEAPAPDLRQRLQRMAEMGNPQQQAWATDQISMRFDSKAQPRPGPWREGAQFTPDPLQAAIAGRAKAQAAQPKPKPERRGWLESMARGGLQGLTADFGDELGGLGTLIGDRLAADVHGLAVAPAGEVYREGRDEQRQANKEAAEDHPGLYHGTNVAASFLTPLEAATAVKGVKAGAAAIRGVRAAPAAAKTLRSAVTHATADAAAYGAGASEADLTKDGNAGEFAGDVGTSALVGRYGTKAMQGLSKYAGKVVTSVRGSLARRVLNEIAEGADSVTTPTQRKKLEKARDAIVAEVVDGPEGNTVREAILLGPEDGKKAMDLVLDRLRAQRTQDYDAFRQGGLGNINVSDYIQRLEGAAKAADKAGRTQEFKGLSHLLGEFIDMARRQGSQIDLEALRGFTTQTEKAADSAIGGLNNHATARLKAKLSAIASDLMDDSLDDAARAAGPLPAGARPLTEVASRIRANNERFNALLTIGQAMEQRGHKEASRQSGVLKAAKGLSQPIAYGATIGATSSDNTEDRLQNAALGAGIMGLAPKAVMGAARGLDRKITTKDIFLNRRRKQVEGIKKQAQRLPDADTIMRTGRSAIVPTLTDPMDAILGAVGARNGEGLPENEIDAMLAAHRKAAERDKMERERRQR